MQQLLSCKEMEINRHGTQEWDKKLLGGLPILKQYRWPNACISAAGEYIVAKENGFFRALTNVEQMEYKHAVYGRAIDRSIAPIEGCRKKRFS